MIGLEKSAIERKSKRKTVVFDRFAAPYGSLGESAFGITGGEGGGLRSSETLYAKTMVNCDLSQGALRSGVGASVVTDGAGKNVRVSESNITKIFCVRFQGGAQEGGKDFFAFLRGDGYLLYYDEETAELSAKGIMGNDTSCVFLRSIKGEERYLFVGSNNARFLSPTGVFGSAPFGEYIGVVCACKNRLFAVKKEGKLAYSSPTEPWTFRDDIDDSGYILLPSALGTPITLLAVGEYVYVFFKHAIKRLRVAGNARDFVLEDIVYSGGQIIKGSVCAVENGVIFLAKDGLWKAQGTDLQPIGRTLDIILDEGVEECQAAVCEGKYFFRYRTIGGLYQSFVAELDGKSWCFSYDLIGLSQGNGTAFFVRGGRLYRLGGSKFLVGGTPMFESVKTEFGVRGQKTLRRLEFSGVGTLQITVDCDGKKFTREASFAGGRAIIPITMRGNAFSFAMRLADQAIVTGVRADVEY
ncbi:MAG: hypothetical protein E7352_03790 [Clostridiales bacterium]|nr:hypothetical protein [Clostridiales bacterium]